MRNFHIVLPIVAFYLYLAGSAPYIGPWDSYDYLKQIVNHQASDLGIGRPVFLGYNILLWESAKRIFGLSAAHVGVVVLGGVVLAGALGVFLFQRLSRRLLPPPAARMAALAFAISPVYAVYSGYVMTEVPMLAALLASALVLWQSPAKRLILCDILGGVFFGLAVGIREQALSLAGALGWIIWRRRVDKSCRLCSMARFGVSSLITILMPALFFYLQDRAGFFERTSTWLSALPLAPGQFKDNVQASLLYMAAMCPGAWLAVAGAGIARLLTGKTGCAAEESASRGTFIRSGSIAKPALGLITCLLLPVAVLWYDADVQMHPRYLLVVLPASVIVCTYLFDRWFSSKKGPITWAVIQVAFWGIALLALSPYRQVQTQKIEFARVIRDSITHEGLLIAGNLSPVLDYYRAIGERASWRILWSGWKWDPVTVEDAIGHAWTDGVPVYLSVNPSGWSYFEKEFLDLQFLLRASRREQIAPMLFRIYPPTPFISTATAAPMQVLPRLPG